MKYMEDHFTAPSEGVGNDSPLKHLRNRQGPTSEPQPTSLQAFSHPEYQSPDGSSMDPPFETEDLSESNGNTAHAVIHRELSPSTQSHRNGTIDHHRFAKRMYTETGSATQMMSPSSTLSALEPRRLSQVSLSQPNNQAASSSADGRTLPSRDVTEETIDDAYVAFILYCNPTVPLSVDSTELKRGFHTPPKSDGKSFQTYKLFELIRKFEKKEIKSWSQLALLLGVEPPIIERKQSAQKVQQYAVRLKRWMHAMHMDAFFAYCNGKPHIYYSQIPVGQDLHAESARDGVPLEEDLALRALHPESRPKRGRKKAEEKDAEGDLMLSPAKRPRIETSLDSADFDSFGGEHSDLFPSNTVPSSAHQDEADQYDRQFDAWTTATPAITPGSIGGGLPVQSPSYRPTNSAKLGGQQFRWRLNAQEANTPATPYPHSAVTPGTSHLPDSAIAEPMSAITPVSSTGRGRVRRRHGPAVSSAWPSGGNVLTGKFRGRPPSNRAGRDGPFTTFLANPKARPGSAIDVPRSSQVLTPVSGREENQVDRQLSQSAPQQIATSAHKQGQVKRAGLQLQVPERSGGSVRLATPTVLVNGGETGAVPGPFVVNHSDDAESDADSSFLSRPGNAAHQLSTSRQENELVRCLATRLAKTVFFMGGSSRLVDCGLARRLAESAIGNLKYAYKQPLDEDAFLADCALWFGLADDLDMSFAAKSSMTELRILPTGSTDNTTTNFEPLEPHHNHHRHPLHPSRNGDAKPLDMGGHKFNMSWKLAFGPLVANFSLPVTLPRTTITAVDHSGSSTAATTATNNSCGDGSNTAPVANMVPTNTTTTPVTHTTTTAAAAAAAGTGGDHHHPHEEFHWKEKFLKLQQERDEEIGRLRRAVIKACF